ncbi:LysR family transcriptional regulator [Phreatobacter sp. AB_2022a]|uniref:LysR family transcriptional regulator n=1 Tax=Phreatobacter sp. AB_2022a TaxID=3003134 RepID=UPI0022876493|nr:LysR family transcriptional regulator [Phreatobacter sp. AB_2022a]MCZ0738697.1 LysR family transcriptional regulator [Phreatobacter sp. AB_2022a]
MDRSEISDLTVFLAIAEHLSFRGAAERMGVTASALSHTLRQMEERLGVRLFNRTTRKVALTDAGLQLLQRLRPAFDEIGEALKDLDEHRGRPLGLLRLHVSQFAAMTLGPVWKRFMATYPDVRVELATDPRMSDIVAEGLDAGIAPRMWVAADMVATRVVGPFRVAVAGAPSYLAVAGRPERPEDLARHDCIRLRSTHDRKPFPWRFVDPVGEVGVTGRLITDDPEIGVRTAVDGLGLVYTAEERIRPFLETGQLVRLVEDWCPDFDGLYLYYPGHRHVPTVLRALIDTIRMPERDA